MNDIPGHKYTSGAGALILARSTGRFLIAHRSAIVRSPNEWCTFGGKCDPGESPEETLVRELREEGGIDVASGMVQALVITRDDEKDFNYHNFLVTFEDEFAPSLCDEVQDYVWCDLGDWPKPMHRGVLKLLADETAKQLLENAVASLNLRPNS